MARRLAITILLAAGGLLLAGAALAQVSPGFDLRWSLFSSGGGARGSPGYGLADTLGQWGGQGATSAHFSVEPGFWPGVAAEPPCTEPLTGVAIQGAASGRTGTPYAFVATIAPAEASAPVIYEWAPRPAQGQGTLGATYEWAEAGTYTVSLTAHNCGATVYAAATIVVRPQEVAQGDSYEADDSCAAARPIALDGALQAHTFHVAGDADWVRFDASAHALYQIEAQTAPASLADVRLDLHATCAGAPEQSFDASFTPGVRMEFRAPGAGPVFLRLANFDPAVAGADVSYLVSVRELQEPGAPKGAVILLAGRLRAGDHLQPNIDHVVASAYSLFRQQGYGDDEIELLATDPALPGYDRPATAANLRDAITVWAAGRVGPERPLTLLLMDHGDDDLLFVDDVGGQRLRPDELDAWLARLEAAAPGTPITIVVEACKSGSFIAGELSASGQRRVVISSTNATTVAHASTDGAQFSDQFLSQLGQGFGLCQSFRSAQDAVRAVFKLQEPWIDSNGNRVPNEGVDCEGADVASMARSREPDDSWAPYILQVVGPARVEGPRGAFHVQARDNQALARVWAVIYPPSYAPPADSRELVGEGAPTLELARVAGEWYSGQYDGFDEAGRYRVVIYAEDASGLRAGPRVFEVQAGSTIFLPLAAR